MWPPVPRSVWSCSSVSSSAERTATPTTSFEAVLTRYTPGLPGRKVADDAPGVEDAQPAKPMPVTPLPHLIEKGLRPQISSMKRTAGLLPCVPHLN